MINKRSIYSTRCWLNGKLQPATISFDEGVITSIRAGKTPGAEDFGDNVIMPGVIDAHVHVNEPGRTDWEGFDTATQAAAAGGTTTIVDMPLNASPVTTTLAAFNKKQEASEGKLHVNVGFYGGLVPGNQQHLEELIHAGVLGIKCFLTHSGIDEFPNVDEAELEAAMPLLAKYKLPLLAHCELKGDCQTKLDAFPTSYKEYLASRPTAWENEAVELMIKLCRKHHCPTHIVHVSSAEVLPLVQQARAEGLPLTAETCAHYIYFNAEDIPDAECVYKCAPPIREKANNDRLRAALKNSLLDFITTDHSPAPPAIKELESGNLLKAWGGIAGLQFLLPAAWTAMKHVLSLEEFIPLLTEHPARFLKAEEVKGKLAEGYDADICIWNPEEAFVVRAEDILHKHDCSPYTGKQLSGTTRETIVQGITVYQNKKIIHKNAGKWLLRK